jgi:hypothetical protein
VPALEHYGFAHPVLGILVVFFAAYILTPATWIALGLVVALVVVTAVAGALARYRALYQVRRWAATQGIREVQRCRRGGFVSWGWSLWSFAETGPYRGVAADGSPIEVLASYYAPAFGAIVFTRCEHRAHPGTFTDGEQR